MCCLWALLTECNQDVDNQVFNVFFLKKIKKKSKIKLVAAKKSCEELIIYMFN